MRRGHVPLVHEGEMTEIRCAIELRADETRQSPGRVVGTIVDYETRARDRPERFRQDALTWPDDGVVLNRQHDRRAPVMRFIPTVEGRSVRIDAPLPDTTAGRDMAAEIRAGLFRGLSLEFKALRETRQNGVRVIEKARLTAAAVVDDPSYATSVAVRHREGGERTPWEVLL